MGIFYPRFVLSLGEGRAQRRNNLISMAIFINDLFPNEEEMSLLYRARNPAKIRWAMTEGCFKSKGRPHHWWVALCFMID